MLELDGKLEFASGDERMRVVATRTEIAVELIGISPLAVVFRRPRSTRRTLRRIGAALVAAGLTLTVTRGRVRILELGSNVRTDVLARAVGVPHLTLFRKYGA